MEVVPIPTARWHNNPFYPLPPNFLELEKESKEVARQIRVNAARQWFVPRKAIREALASVIPTWSHLTPEQQEDLIITYKGDAFLASVRFFDEYYLKPDLDTGFESGFYDIEPVPNAPFHHDMLRDWGSYLATLHVCPRGSAKSMNVRKAMTCCTISRPTYKTLYSTSSDKNATETATIVRNQLYNNPRIQDDWRPEMPNNRVKPQRGDLPTGIEWFTTDHGSQIVTFSINSKMRGGRPLWFILDDPEYDPSASTSMPALRSFMRDRILKVALPMLMRREAKLSWLATFVSKRHYAYQAFETEKVLEKVNGVDVVREVARIPEFEYWKRTLVVAAKAVEGTNKLVSCWPHMWPADAEEKRRLNLDPSTRTLGDIRVLVGDAVFASEYQGRPGESDDGYFRLDENKHSWSLQRSTIDDAAFKNPRDSAAIIEWTDGENKKSMAFSEFLDSVRLFITVDTSRTARKDSDYKVATLMAITEEQDLFVLDMWAGQCHPERLILSTFEMAAKWQCRYIYVEEIEDGVTLVRTMRNMIMRMAAIQGPNNLPVVRGFNPGYTTKNSKISALISRFELGKIKFPFQRRMTQPWSMLFDQIEGFNPDVEDGGLQNDDCLDTVSMSEYAIPAVRRSVRNNGADEPDIITKLERGDRFTKDGVPLVAFLDIQQMGPKLLEIAQRRDRPAPSLPPGESLA